MTEKQLLDRFITANDPDAFRALIELHGPMVFAVCRSVLRETHDAEDAFQNTFLALARRGHDQERRDRGTMAPSCGAPRGEEGTVPGLATAGPRECLHRLRIGASPSLARPVDHPLALRRGESLAGGLSDARGALLPGREDQPGGRGAVELPDRDDQGETFEGSTDPAWSLESSRTGRRLGVPGDDLRRMTGGRDRPPPTRGNRPRPAAP